MHIAWEKSSTDYQFIFTVICCLLKFLKKMSHIGTQIEVSFVL